MLSQELLEYCIIEWVPAAVETLVSLRLFPNLCRDTSRYTSLDIAKHTATSCSEGWEGSPPCQYTPNFIPRSVQLFKVYIPQVEGLRSALLSEARFGTHIPWRIRVDVYLRTSCEKGVCPLADRIYFPSSKSKSFCESSTRGVLAGASIEVDKSSQGTDYPLRAATYKFQKCECFSNNTPTACDVPFSQASKRLALTKPTKLNVKLLERWMLSFEPFGSSECQDRFGHRKLCTALKGLLAAAHMLPTHAALCILEDERNALSREKPSYRLYSHSIEIRIAGQWTPVDSKSSSGKVFSPVWSPIVSYTANIGDPSSLHINDCSEENAWVNFKPIKSGNSGNFGCVGSSEHGGLRGDSRRGCKHCSPHAGVCEIARRQRDRRIELTTCRETSHPVNYLAELNTDVLRSRSSTEGVPDIVTYSRTEESAPAPRPVGFNTDCEHKGTNSFSNRTPDGVFENMEMRNLFCVTTRGGSIGCTVQYDEDLAEKLLAFRELENVESCLSDFHTVTASSSQTEREGEVVRSGALSCVCHAPIRCDFSLERYRDISSSEITCHCQDGLSAYRRSYSGSCCHHVCSVTQNDSGSGRWHSLLQDTAFKQARRLASLSAYAISIRQVFESYPSKIVRLVCSIVDGGAPENQRISEGESGIRCPSDGNLLMSTNGKNCEVQQGSQGNGKFSSLPLHCSRTALAVDVTALFEFENKCDTSVDEYALIGTLTAEKCLALNKASKRFDNMFLSGEERSSVHSRCCVSQTCDIGEACAQGRFLRLPCLLSENKTASSMVWSMIHGCDASAFKSLWYLSKNIGSILRVGDLLDFPIEPGRRPSDPCERNSFQLVSNNQHPYEANRRVMREANMVDSICRGRSEWDMIILQAAVIGARRQEELAFNILEASSSNWDVISSNGQFKWTAEVSAGWGPERNLAEFHQEACDIGKQRREWCGCFQKCAQLGGSAWLYPRSRYCVSFQSRFSMVYR